MKSGLFLDIIIAESTTILQLLSGKNQALLVGRNAEMKSVILWEIR
jgi:hypothetical protein